MSLDRRTTEDRRAVERQTADRRMCIDLGSSSGPVVRLLTVDEVCFVLQIDARTADKMDLPWVWVRPNKRRLRVCDLDEFVEKNRLVVRELQ